MIQLLWLLMMLVVCGGANGQRWVQLHDDIDGEKAYDNAGHAVAMSGDGTTVAVGAPSSDANGDNSGRVRVFRDSGSAWLQLGDDFDGDAAYDYSVMSTSPIQHRCTHTYPSYVNRGPRYRCRMMAIQSQLVPPTTT
jgi:hypothetical protein